MFKSLFRLAFIIGSFAIGHALACTAIARDYQGQWFSASNYDWSDGRAYGVVNQRGVEHHARGLPKNNKPLYWKVKYGSLTIDMVANQRPNKAAVVDGLNEKGLSVTVLELDQTRYAKAKMGQAVVGSAQLAQYLLDRYASVAEAVKGLPQVAVVASLYQGQSVPLHYVLNDASGDSAVVEYLHGRLQVYTGKQLPVHVLTNTPYRVAVKRWQRRLKNKATLWPAGFTSMPRFIRAANFLRYPEVPKSRWSQISLLFVGLSTAIEPPNSTWPTQWQVVRNNSIQHLCFRASLNQHVRCFDVNRFDLDHPKQSAFRLA